MSVQYITTLLEFYLKNAYHLFQVKYYGQDQGSVIGSMISPIAANLENKVINTASTLQEYGKGMLLTHLSCKRQNIGLNFYNKSAPLTIT